ncbi:TonB-dependent receptor [Paraflavisolibacter sp. H34]|uniref:SusC/RagA family TonB-linked outer membrane protein n=1 Tax=Huijunlia imazamoxiresistens TaxID=3127457 RepID=UPI003018B5F0
MKKFILFLLLLQVLAVAAIAQGKIVTGIVSDSTGPLGGVSVWEKGLNANGTATNNDGKFTLTLKGKGTSIIVNSVGYRQQEVNVAKSGAVAVLLSAEVKSDEEVVVVAYGRQKKITMTGAVSVVSGDEIRLNPAASIQNAMVGRMPGLFSQQVSGRPGADAANLFIRGQSSFNAGANTPLLIVDDIEVGYDQFQRMDPNEVESLTILKDASTTAVYGIKGANGVIVVTTRRGRLGAPKISFNTQSSLNQPTKLPKYLGSYETAKLYNEALYNDYVRNGGIVGPGSTFKPRFDSTDLALFQNGQDPYGHPDVDWKSVLFKKFARQHKGNLDVSGGTESVKYFVSLGYLYQDGMLKNYSEDQDVKGNYFHKRYNYRSNLDVKVTPTTDLRLDLFGNLGEVNTPRVSSPNGIEAPNGDLFYDFSSFKTLSPFAYPVYNPNGSFGYSKWQRDEMESAYNRNNVVGRLTYLGYSRNYESNMSVVANVNQKLAFLTKGLSFTGRVAYNSNYGYNRTVTREVADFPSYIFNPKDSSYENRTPDLYRVRRFFTGYGGGSTVRVLDMQAILNYDRTFGVHHLYGLFLARTNSDLRRNDNVIYNFVPNNSRGYSARIGYDYRQKYLFQFNAGYNGSDRFVGDKRYGFFPAASAGWNISEEPFFKDNIHFVDRLKLRGSWGVVGNDKLGNNFTYYYLYEFNQNNGTGGAANFGTTPTSGGVNNAITEGRLGNRNISWEKERKADLGLEIGLFKNRLSGTFEYFNNYRWDIIVDRNSTSSSVSRIFGASLPPVNLGKVANKGYEAELAWRDDLGKNFSYFVKGNLSFAKNKILFQDEPPPAFSYQALTGNSIGQILGYVWTGQFYQDADDIAKSPKSDATVFPGDLKYADISGDGRINADDRTIIGNPNLPNTTFGLNLGGRFKGLSFSVLFQGVRGSSVRGAAEAIQAFGANLTDVHRYAWTPERGNDARYPILTNATMFTSNPSSHPSSFWLISADYIRLRNAEMSYSLPKSLVSRVKLQDIRVFANGNNLALWTNLSKLYDFDPEINSGSTRSNYPPQRVYNLGFNVTF